MRYLSYILLCLFFTCANLVSAQEQSESGDTDVSKHGFFAEVLGAAPYYSLNYTRRVFNSDKVKGYFRIGGSVWQTGVAVPVGLSLLVGSGDHNPELSFNVTPNTIGVRFWDREASDVLLDLVIGFGYRYQPRDKRFFLNAGLYPFLQLDPTSSELSEKKAEFKFRVGFGIGCFF